MIGPSYSLKSLNTDAQKTVNWYTETDESGEGKSAQALCPTPGLRVFANAVGKLPVRGEWITNSRMFAVIGVTFYEVNADGTLTDRGTVVNDGKLVSMASSSTQLLIAAGGIAYVFTYATNIFLPLAVALFAGPVYKVGYCDGFFIALIQSSNEFQVSSPEDATAWDLSDITQISVFSDQVLSMIVDHRQIWLWGPHESVVYYDSGDELFPFDVVPGGFIEQGICAPESPAQLDNGIFWLGGQTQGRAIVWRANGYTPQRVSNHAVETAIQSYSRIDDAVGWAYQDQGHSFYALHFPTARKTWVYDIATNEWHERDRWNPMTGQSEAFHAQCHVFAFGKHLVGDWASGKIYEMNINILDDDGGPIRRERRAPHISSEQEWIFHHKVEIDVETGLGPIPPLTDGFGQPRAPLLNMSWSDDGAQTWSNEYSRECGNAGQYKTRVIFRRLGKSRDRVYKIVCTDPVPWRVTDAYLFATPGFASPTERISTQYQKAE